MSKRKLSEQELKQQYKYRVSSIAFVIGKWHGSSKRKMTIEVLREPSAWSIWAMSLFKPLIPTNDKRRVRITPLVPIFYLYSFVFLYWVKYIYKRDHTMKKAEDWCKSEVMRFVEQNLLETLSEPSGIAKYDSRILHDPEYSEPDNLKNRARETVYTILTSTPLNPNYPRFTSNSRKASRWQKWLGLKPNDSLKKVMWKAVKTGWKKKEIVVEINSYFTALGIAKERGYNKGRINEKSLNTLLNEEYVHKTVTHVDKDGNTNIEVIDRNSEMYIENIDNQLLLQKINEIITDPKDKLALEIYYSSIMNQTTIEHEHERKIRKCKSLNLNTPTSIRQRFSRLKTKYPKLSLLKNT